MSDGKSKKKDHEKIIELARQRFITLVVGDYPEDTARRLSVGIVIPRGRSKSTTIVKVSLLPPPLPEPLTAEGYLIDHYRGAVDLCLLNVNAATEEVEVTILHDVPWLKLT